MCDPALLAMSTAKGALGGLSQNLQQRANPGQPMQMAQPPATGNRQPSMLDSLIQKRKNRVGTLPINSTPRSFSPIGQPASTQAPQGSSTNDDMPNQMPGFGYRPQQGGFGDEDFLRKYFSGSIAGGGQGFNG